MSQGDQASGKEGKNKSSEQKEPHSLWQRLNTAREEKKEDAMTIGDETHTDRGTSLSRAEAAQPQTAPLIVIVEEQPAVRELLHWMLLLAGYRTRMYAEREAILVLQPGDGPEVLLLDLSLHSAAEAQEYVRRVRAHWQLSYSVMPAIIILTTQPQVQAALLPREQVLLKPFHVHDLLALIQQAAPVCSI